jgi:heme/copper-type cytochrome/quinol oxidase subunit 3
MPSRLTRSCFVLVMGAVLLSASPSKAGAELSNCPTKPDPAAVTVVTTLRLQDQPLRGRIEPQSTTQITLPAGFATGLIEHRRFSPAYLDALDGILCRAQVFNAFEPDQLTQAPSVQINDGYAVVSIVADGPPFEFDPRDPSDVSVEVPPKVPSAVTIYIRLETKPERIEKVSPLPSSDDGKGHLEWLIHSSPHPQGIALHLDIARHDSVTARVGDRDGYWHWLYPADPMIASLLVLLLVPWALPRPGMTPGLPAAPARLARRLAKTSLLFAAAYLVGYWVQTASYDVPVRWLDQAASWLGVPEQLDLPGQLHEIGMLITAGLAVVASTLLYLYAARRANKHRRRASAFALFVVGLGAAYVACDVSEFNPFSFPSYEFNHDPVWLLVVGLIAVVCFTSVLVFGVLCALVAPWRRRAPSFLILGAAALFSVAFVGQQLEAWRRLEKTFEPSAAALGHSYWRGPAVYDFIPNFSRSVVDAVVSVSIFIALSALLAVIRVAGRRSGDLLVDPKGWLIRVFALLYAGFIVGSDGSLPSVRVALPVAFGTALIGMMLLPRERPDLVAAATDRDEHAEAAEIERRREAEALKESQRKLADAYLADELERDDYYKQDSELKDQLATVGAARHASTSLADDRVLSLGPEPTWWLNARLAVRWGAVLAIVPLAYYVYVFSSHLGQTLSFDTGYRVIGAVTGVAGELAFWLVGSLIFGALFPHLPGRNGILKGLSLGSIYLIASLAAVVGFHENYNPQWSFRAFEFLLYLATLGIVFDWRTLGARHGNWRQLLDYYQVKDFRAVTAYAVPVVLSVAVIAQQLHNGDAHDAIISIIKGFSGTAPQTPNGP